MRPTRRQGTSVPAVPLDESAGGKPARRRKTASPRVRKALVSAVGGASEVAGATVEGISRTVSRAIAGLGGIADSFVQAVSSVSHGTIQAAMEVGGDLAQATRGIAKGVMRDHGQGSDLRSLDQAAESVIRTTAKLSGDLGRAARGLVEGAIETAKELGVDASEAAATAATAATRAAADIGGTAGAKVREAVVGTIQGVKVILKEPFEESGTPRIRPGPIDRRR